ncbi:MAG TPA: DinB family protein [Gemmatimonadaceae bacterium]|nr:DinB family protein [Gemmatimonadaceae bacterium]
MSVRSAAAQHYAPDRATAVEARRLFMADLDTLQHKFLALAEAFPAEKYAWRPAPSVRSVGEAFMHVASEFYLYTPLAYGATPSPLVAANRASLQKFESMSSKPEVLQHLKEGFAYAKKTLDGLDPSALAGVHKFFGADRTILETSFDMTDDLHEHLGQLIAYARMNGIKPPWSK